MASTVGWSMMTAIVFSTFCPPTSSVGTLTSPIDPNSVMSGFLTPLSRPASLATLLFMSVIGAPVSKISLYGPLPLTLTMTVMWPVGVRSNGTTIGLATSTGFAFGSSARAAGARTNSRENSRYFFMSQSLPRLDGQLDLLTVLAAAPDDHLDRFPGGSLVREALQAVEPIHGAALELDEAVAWLEAGLGRRSAGQHVLDHSVAAFLGDFQSQERPGDDVGLSLATEDAAEQLHDAAKDLQPALPALAA